MKDRQKKPLYRKVNTRTHGVSHDRGGSYRHTRRKDSPVGMSQGKQRGLDYTPLFKFLLSKAGGVWTEIHSEAVSRLDKPEPIFWQVAMNIDSAEEVVRLGDNAYYSGLYVDEEGRLQITNPAIDEDSLQPSCKCCTHTFNGIEFTQQFSAAD